jgi:phosphate transport system substrate-binding protein
MTRPRAARLLAPLLLIAAAGCQDAAAGGRTAIRVVGSSTVFPFSATIAERFVARHPDVSAPVVESTGTGGGMRLFCAGVGSAHPDVEGASRRMDAGEYRQCAANGAGDLLEVEIGRDGVAFARATEGSDLPLTAALLYRALAASPGGRANTARLWRDLDPALPAVPILVYGPPATSGTRDALADLILRRGCAVVDPGLAGTEAGRLRCTRLRTDGVYVDAGENDNIVVQRLRANPGAIGVLGYGHLRANADMVAGLAIDGVRPSPDAIASGAYPGSRPLFLYVKRAHLAAVPRLDDLLRLYAQGWGPGGPLARRGLIVAPAATRARSAAIVAGRTPLDPATLR